MGRPGFSARYIPTASGPGASGGGGAGGGGGGTSVTGNAQYTSAGTQSWTCLLYTSPSPRD